VGCRTPTTCAPGLERLPSHQDCSINKWTLISSNLVLLVMGVIIIIVAAVAKAASIVCTMPILVR